VKTGAVVFGGTVSHDTCGQRRRGRIEQPRR
jgi:hypothetical protein